MGFYSPGLLYLLMAVWLNAVGVRGASNCEPITVPMCKSMPWNLTHLPNLVHYNSQTNTELALQDFQALVDTNCSPVLTFLLCTVYVPMCNDNSKNRGGRREQRGRGRLIPPCRSLCEKARQGCEGMVNRYNRTWPAALDCDTLPQYDKGVCVTPESFDQELKPPGKTFPPSDFNRLPDCKCKQKKQKLRRKIYMQRNFAYALQATYLSASGVKGGPLIVSIRADSILKNSSIHISPNRELTLWVKSECVCPLLVEDRQYLILGHEDPQHNRLIYNESSMAVVWKDKWPESIQKWERYKAKLEKARPPAEISKKESSNVEKTGRKRNCKVRRRNKLPKRSKNTDSKNCPKRRKGRIKDNRKKTRGEGSRKRKVQGQMTTLT